MPSEISFTACSRAAPGCPDQSRFSMVPSRTIRSPSLSSSTEARAPMASTHSPSRS
ncbi:Uncharacterised protein [Mycobacteroides abscessus subsp. abscessus]|nr:Uncharacterised protein [Mycobacteroides abscessus subsp. abscessus]